MSHFTPRDQSAMPESWFRRFAAYAAQPSSSTAVAPDTWRLYVRSIADALWREAWTAGAAWQDAHARPPVIMQMPLTREAEQMVEEFRRRLKGLPDAPPEG